MTQEILVVAPGGDRATGGICRMVDYATRAWNAERREPPMRVLDSGGMEKGGAMLRRFAVSLADTARACVSGRAALLHVHVATRGSVVRKGCFVLLARALGVPVVLHMHGADFEIFFDRVVWRPRMPTAWMFRACRAVIALGPRARDHAVARLGVDPGAIHVLPNAVPEPERIGSLAERHIGDAASRTSCRILFLGALGDRKGLDTLFAALASPALAAADWTLEVAGDGDRARWEATAEAAGIAERVRFRGWLASEAARAAIDRADMLVLPSRHEAMPIAILEAMAAGRPVVATDVGEVGELVAQAVNGFLVPPGDAGALAGAIGRLVASPAMRSAMGQAGRDRYEASFTIGLFNRRLARLYAALLDRGSERAPAGSRDLASFSDRGALAR